DRVLDVLELTFECDVLPGKQPPHDLERLRETRDGPVERKPERAKFGLVPSRAEPERESTPGDLIDRCGHARDHPRRVECGGGHERAEPNSRRDHGERGKLRPRVPRPASVPSGIPGFHATWYGQSGYPTLCPGQISRAVVAYYNSGSLGWAVAPNTAAYLGTWNPEPGQDQPSVIGGNGTHGSPNTRW